MEKIKLPIARMIVIGIIILIVGTIVKIGVENKDNLVWCLTKSEVCASAREAYHDNVKEPLFLVPDVLDTEQ